ncbi:MAG TPA: nuclear transport factor 2 family protein [Candidatus Acidoferrum sp.]|nr:nuclear transport factor 2 family protein [Candidatus Acidoferrum sp.]
MIRPLTVGILALGLFSLVLFPREHHPVRAASSGTEAQHSDSESLIQIEKDLFKAHWTSNPEVVEMVDKVFADDWVNLEPDRRGPGKPEMMDLLDRLYRDKKALPKPYPVMQQRDLQVFLFGNTAVATYFYGDTAKPDQHPTDVTDVFVKDGGAWKLRLSRASPHFQQ